MGHTLTREDASRGGIAAAPVRRRIALERMQRGELIEQLASWCEREEIGPFMLGAATYLAACAVSGEIPTPESPLERLRMAEAARVLHGMGRLEMGESTSNAATMALDPSALLDRLSALAATQPGAVDVDSMVNADTSEVEGMVTPDLPDVEA